jgi:hypothetical protein
MSKKNKKQNSQQEQQSDQPEVSQPEVSQPEVSLEEMREKRREVGEAKKAAKAAELDQRDEFRKFFAKKREKLNLDSSMEHILWLHFVATGHAEKEKFEDGLKHFGIH